MWKSQPELAFPRFASTWHFGKVQNSAEDILNAKISFFTKKENEK
jgi:hypothetical protein